LACWNYRKYRKFEGRLAGHIQTLSELALGILNEVFGHVSGNELIVHSFPVCDGKIAPYDMA